LMKLQNDFFLPLESNRLCFHKVKIVFYENS